MRGPILSAYVPLLLLTPLNVLSSSWDGILVVDILKMWPSSPAEGEPTKPFILNLVFAAPELPPDGHRFLFVLSSPGFSGSGGWGEGTLRDGFLVFLLRMPGVHFLGLCCSW